MQNQSVVQDSHLVSFSLGGLFLWLIVAVFYGLDYLQHTVSSVLILPLSKSLGVNYIHVANMMNVYFPVYALSQIPAGYLMDRFGLRRSLFAAAMIVSGGLLLMALPALHFILAGRILIAMGSAFAFVGGLKAASVYLPESVFPLMIGILQSIGVVGGLLGQVLINALIQHVGWHQAIYNVGIFGFVWAVMMLLFLKKQVNTSTIPSLEHGRKATESIGAKIKAVMSDGQLWLLAFYAALMVGAVMSTFAESYSVLIVEKLKHVGSQHAAWLSSLIFVGVAVGAPVHGMIAARFKNKGSWLLITAVATCLVFATIPSYIHWGSGVNGLALLYFLVGFFVSSMLLAFSMAKERFMAPRHATAFAFINMMIGLGGFFIPLLFGAVIGLSSRVFHVSQSLMVSVFSLLVPLLVACLIAWVLRSLNKGQLGCGHAQ